MAVSLYTSRVVLEILGVEDYGIYNVVGGIVSFFAFLSGTMASATQRFFSFALGQNKIEKLKSTFTTNCVIYASIAFLAFIVLEILGLWFVNEHLRIPPERFESVKIVFHYSVLTFVATIFSSPFRAIIIAHEDMRIYAYISIFEALLKLGLLFFLSTLEWDKLEVYGLLVFIVSFINVVIYISICVRKYEECQFRKFYWDKTLVNEIVGFTGWTLFGQITTVTRNQAITILLNQVFNPVVVASRAIAINATNQINVLSNNFNVGLYPPIIKSYAAADKNKMFSLIFSGSKVSFFLMWIVALPLFLEMDSIMHIWLKQPPPDAVLFARLSLIEVLINSISLPITAAARAPGKMRVYELSLGTIQLAIFFVAWLVLALGGAPYSVFLVAIGANLVMFLIRLIIVKTLIGLPLGPFLNRVAFPILLVAIVSAGLSSAMYFFLPEGLIFMCINIFFSVIPSCGAMYFIGINKSERKSLNKIIGARINRYLN